MSTVVGIDFKKITLKDALDLAILIEEEANERYQEFAASMEAHRTPDAARFFHWMAQNEARHGEQLAKKRQQLFGNQPRSVSRSSLFDVEAPEYDEARASMSLRQALHAARRSEEKARAFFAGALKEKLDEQVKTLFEELRGEEDHHIALIDKELEKAPAEDGFRPEDFEDEPVGHD